MDHDTSQSEPKRKKDVLSDSEEDECVKRHKTVTSDEESEKEEAENSQLTKDVTGSTDPMEENQNGKYKEPPTRNQSDSESAGTDVELTSDEETSQNYQKSRKKRKISIKSERKTVNDVLNGSSSESEDDQPDSPKSPSSSKKFYRKRRNFSGNKSHGKVSSESESYKTESDSDNEPLKQKSKKGSSTPHSRSECKKSSHELPQTSKKCEVKVLQKNPVETESSGSEDNSNLQKKPKYSSSDESESAVKEEQTLSDDKSNDVVKSTKKFVSKNSGSSSDEWVDPTRRQRERELRRQKKRGSALKGNAIPTKAKTQMKSNDNITLNSDSEKSSVDDSRPKIKEEEEVTLNSDSLQKGKAIKKEGLSSDSDSEASDKQVLVEDKQERKNSEIKGGSSSPTSSSSEASDEQASVKGNLKIENSGTKRRSNSPTSSSSQKKRRNNSSSSSEGEKKKSGKRQRNKLPDEDKRIISLKKYLKTAGIRVHNYSELWKDCRSNKAKAQKMLSLLEQNGLKGRPTIEKCKKLRKKIETRKEVEELDLSNVMDCGEGRTRRSRLGASGSLEFSQDYPQQKASELRGRLKFLADSDSE